MRKAALTEAISKDKEAVSEADTELTTLREKSAALADAVATAAKTANTTDFAQWQTKIKQYDSEREQLEKDELTARAGMEKATAQTQQITTRLATLETDMQVLLATGKERKMQLEKQTEAVNVITGGADANAALTDVQIRIKSITADEERLKSVLTAASEAKAAAEKTKTELTQQVVTISDMIAESNRTLTAALAESGFPSADNVKKSVVDQKTQRAAESAIKAYETELHGVVSSITMLEEKLSALGTVDGTSPDTEALELQLSALKTELDVLDATSLEKTRAEALLKEQIEKMSGDLEKLAALKSQRNALKKELDMYYDLTNLFEGNQFSEFLAKKQLKYITAEASIRFREMTGGRYGLELDGTDFVVCDNHNGGVRRSPRTLSGGETFIASLCLALALSSKIQMNNNTPLEFFFLDEGFGTLDASLTDTVMDALERLRNERLTVGVISHVQELQARISKKLNVYPPIEGIRGTRLEIE